MLAVIKTGGKQYLVSPGQKIKIDPPSLKLRRAGKIKEGDEIAFNEVLLLEKGKKGEIYNVCSGRGHSLKKIINMMAEKLDLEVNIILDNKLLRPDDNKIIIGSNKKIINELGWKPRITISESLNDILEYWGKYGNYN